MENNRYDVIVIGAGPAGLAAAEAAHKGGAGRILLLERDNTLGHPQPVHPQRLRPALF